MNRGLILLAALIFVFCVIMNCMGSYFATKYPILEYLVLELDMLLDLIGLMFIITFLNLAKKPKK
jgi:hypothetical protein